MSYSVAIDGPSGAGKSTIASALAKELGILHLDTGAMYRAVGLKMLRLGIDFSDEDIISQILEKTDIDIKFEDGKQRVYLDGENIDSLIRLHEVSKAAASISGLKCVREKLAQAQRKLALKYDMVVDGRDIGTYVLPNADFKFFLTADEQVRARRRYEELKEKGQNIDYNIVLEDIKKRDKMDMTRAIAPLKKAQDAIVIDSSNMTPAQVVQTMISYIKERL